jgi:hydroxymethylpyrimidine pyrophosphatase-like HAD family hydrolase
MSAVELVVTDLDGTFWYHDQRVDPKVLAAVAELERRGVPLLVATGRRLASTRGPLARRV